MCKKPQYAKISYTICYFYIMFDENFEIKKTGEH